MYLVMMLLFSGCNPRLDSLSGGMNTFEHNGEDREFVLYIPESNDDSTAVPLMVNFHGFGGTIGDYMETADMRSLADEHNFILVYPQGTMLEGYSHWNSGLPGGDNKSTADDFGFILALIGHISASYSIDADRIYASGYSNGGFMSYSFACYHSDRFAAIAPVSSTMLNGFDGDCAPQRPMPIISLNGTSDDTIPYDGGTVGYQSIPDVLNYWVEANNISEDPITSSFDDNGTTIEHFLYEGGDDGVAVSHYKVNGGYHVWFDNNYEGSDTGHLIWDFVSQYDLNGTR
jgi:polyhydroxybutyrate depolymerase